MLVLSRKNREKIKVGNNIIISIEGLAVGKARIGIEAPRDLEIVRSVPCLVCGRASFEKYLDYDDLPYCGHPKCAEKIKNNKSLFQ